MNSQGTPDDGSTGRLALPSWGDDVAGQDPFPQPTAARAPRGRTRSGRRGRLVVALVSVGVVGGLGLGSMLVGSPLPGSPSDQVPPPSGAGALPEGDGGDEGTAGSRPGAASRSVRDPQLGLDSPGSVPLALERTVEEGSGLTGREVVPDLGGLLVTVPGEAPAPGAGTVKRVRVEVEQGLPVDAEVFAAAVLTTLNDPRGWGPVDGVTFARTGGDADLRVVLASPATTDRLCAPLNTGGVYSCGRGGVAALNFARWVEGASDFGTDMVAYRQYVVNHEVGHLLGHPHVSCPAPGALAPVMVQQSMSTGGCAPNGWPALS